MLCLRSDTNQTNALFKTSKALDADDVRFIADIAGALPEGSTALDIGANFGVFSLAMAYKMADKGGIVHAFEAQRIIAYMLAGSVALNSIENVHVHHAAVGNSDGEIDIPNFDYRKESSFGSIEFGSEQREYIGQVRRAASGDKVPVVRIDDMKLSNVGLVKLDVEGMETDVLRGAARMFERDKPWVLLEWIKSDKAELARFFEKMGYQVFLAGLNLLCIPPATEIKINHSLPCWDAA